ncbi:MAG TPA: hypothetical protein VKG43_10525 [Acidimicrobiales bacterium]|nr:hypothetical protein [Acidimicrobiales bacterium]
MTLRNHLLRGELTCPACGNDVLEAVWDGRQTNFVCLGCWSCWHWELGWAAPVSAAACQACGHRAECLRREHARLGA